MISKDRLEGFIERFLAKNCFVGDVNTATVAFASQPRITQLCRLWAGMGNVYKVEINIANMENTEFIIKHVTPPPTSRQSFGDRRKAKSYQVEANFYKGLASSLNQEHDVRLPIPFLVDHGPGEGEITICMSVLHGTSIDTGLSGDVNGALVWLARFHAAHWGINSVDSVVNRVGLQTMGSYWYLETRPDEHESMSCRGWEGRLKRAARAIDACLKRDPMQCLIHGDPKEANIMRLDNGTDSRNDHIGMYDFQYCGKGTPTRDLAYFLCSSCDEDDEEMLVNFYYEELSKLLSQKGSTPPSIEHFRGSLELAFSDYCRFMCGWGHWGYDLKRRVQTLLARLDNGKLLNSEEAYDSAIRRVFW